MPLLQADAQAGGLQFAHGAGGLRTLISASPHLTCVSPSHRCPPWLAPPEMTRYFDTMVALAFSRASGGCPIYKCRGIGRAFG